MDKIKIVFAGHTNTGKTTLIRTLMKSTVGEVADRANVTKKGELYFYGGLQADFIDTPGFRFASIYYMYLENRDENPSYKMSEKMVEKLALDMEAANVIRRSNVAVYVGGLDVVPDDGHYDEIMLVKRLQPQTIGLLNKQHISTISNGVEIVNERINQWKDYFHKNGIDEVIIFDAHWDKYSKVGNIYESISSALSSYEKKLFLEGLEVFRKRQLEIREEACKMLSNLISELQKIEVNIKRKEFIDAKDAKKINSKFYEPVSKFMLKVNELYKLAAELPTDSRKSIKMKLKSKVDWFDKAGVGGIVAGVFASISALIGAAIGAVGAGIVTGGLGIVGGAVAGLKIGGAVGGGLGGLLILGTSSDDDKLIVKLDSEQIKNIYVKCITFIWGLSINGYGRSKKLDEAELGQLVHDINKIIKDVPSLNTNLSKINKSTVQQKSLFVLERLEKEWKVTY